MTVSELIKALSALPNPDATVEVWSAAVEDWMPLEEINAEPFQAPSSVRLS